MDKVTETLLSALKTAMADPAEQRLFRSGKLAGLFAGKTSVNAEAALSKLLRNVASGSPHGEDGFAYRELTILFADLRGFMSISDRYPPEVVRRA